MTSTWQFWALLSACFAALTAVFAKMGVAQVDPDLATLIRTCVIVAVLFGIVAAAGKLHLPAGLGQRGWLFLTLSGLATGASWLCYFRALKLGDASRVAPLDKLSVVLVAIFGAVVLGERLSAVNWVGVVMIAGGAVLLAARI